MPAAIHPSPSRAARSMAASLWPPMRIGMGCWTGRGSGSIDGRSQNSPWNSTCLPGAVHSVRNRSMCSSVRRPRRSHAMPMASASSFNQPAPTPQSSRPSE